jgi:ribonuclease E
MTVACASPEMASGKVWIRYPVARVQDQPFEELNNAPENVETIAVAPVDIAEAVTVVEPQAVVIEPQAVETVAVETTHPEVIAAPVDAQPEVIAQEDTVVAEKVAEAAEPAAPVEAATEDVVEAIAEVEVEAEVEAVPQAETETEEPAPVVVEQLEPEVKPQPVNAAVVERHNATAPMTRAPAPEYEPETPRQSDWVRPAFDFDGKGSAGGHSATHQATAPATRPQPAE